MTIVTILQVALKDLLEAEDLHSMFGWLESLAKNPFSDDDTAAVMPGMSSLYASFLLSLQRMLAAHT